jgi:glycosyltransferase involved in cell wall biosynthesis
LLDALNTQTRIPDEIIVADASSRDNTVQIAQRAGCLVVAGGMPARGRNAGASAAKGDVFLFLDADVLPESNFIEKILDEFIRLDCAVATCQIEPLEKYLANSIVMGITNIYISAIQAVSPHAPGYCILARREIHEAIGGFNEAVQMAEDHDYVQRGARHGKFKVLEHVRIPVSMRRPQKDGLLGWILTALWCEFYVLSGKPMYSMPFRYEFGAHAPPTVNKVFSRRAFDTLRFHKQVGYLIYPFRRLSTIGQSQFGYLGRVDWMGISRQKGNRLINWLHFHVRRRVFAKRNKF